MRRSMRGELAPLRKYPRSGKCRHLNAQPNQQQAMSIEIAWIGFVIPVNVRTVGVLGIRPEIIRFEEIVVRTACTAWGRHGDNGFRLFTQISLGSIENTSALERFSASARVAENIVGVNVG